MKKVLFLGLVLLSLLSCTENTRARHWGGKEVVTLQPNHRFINATWKEGDLWIVTEDTITHQFYFSEKSRYGLLEGSIEFK